MPPELLDRVCVTPRDLFHDGDAFTGDIYDLCGEVAHVVKARVARAFVDLNRAPEDRPPAHPDGVVKSATCLARPIYRPGREPSRALTEALLRRYHTPFHARLGRLSAEPGLRLCLDCHSMLAVAPPISHRPGEARPLFCLGNRDGRTAPAALLRDLAMALAQAFEVSLEEVRLNDPFKGGYIIQRHGSGPLPWIQVEMNRSFYLDDPWFDRDSLQVSPERLAELRSRFLSALLQLQF